MARRKNVHIYTRKKREKVNRRNTRTNHSKSEVAIRVQSRQMSDQFCIACLIIKNVWKDTVSSWPKGFGHSRGGRGLEIRGREMRKERVGFARWWEAGEMGDNYTIFVIFCSGNSAKRQEPTKKGGNQGRVSQKSRKHFSPKKPFVKI